MNNTYGIPVLSPQQAADALDALNRPGGGRDQVLACKALQAQYDPNNYGNNVTVDNTCVNAINFGLYYVEGPGEATGVSIPNLPLPPYPTPPHLLTLFTSA